MRDLIVKLIQSTVDGFDEDVTIRIVKRDSEGSVTHYCDVPISHIRYTAEPPMIAIEWSAIEAQGFTNFDGSGA